MIQWRCIGLLGLLVAHGVQACPINGLTSASPVATIKQAFGCGQYAEVAEVTARWFTQPAEARFEQLEMRITALANLGALAEAILTIRFAVQRYPFEADQQQRLQQLGGVISQALGVLDEDALFAAVLTNPSDRELNFRLILAQEVIDNPKGLAVTLHRVLMTAPSDPLANDLLLRLNLKKGNLAEAEVGLRKIAENPELLDAERASAQSLLDQLQQAKSPHVMQYFINQSFGEAYNPQSVSESGKAIFTAFPGTLLDFGSDVTREEFRQSVVGFSYQYQMPYQDPQALGLGVTLVDRIYPHLDSLHLEVASINASYAWLAQGHQIYSNFSRILLVSRDLASALQVGGTYRLYQSEAIELDMVANLTRNHYHARADNVSNQDSTGMSHAIGWESVYRAPLLNATIDSSLTYFRSDLRALEDSKESVTLAAGVSVPINAEWTGSVSMTEEWSMREGPDATISSDVREDRAETVSLGLTWTPPNGSEVWVPSAQMTYSETTNHSNIINFDTKTSEIAIAATWVFQ